MFNHEVMNAGGRCNVVVNSKSFPAAIENIHVCGSEMYFEGRLLAPLYRPPRLSYKERYCEGQWDIFPEIKNVIFNDPATIVFWSDGSKTVVKCQNNELFDAEKGLATAIAKKALGNKGNYCNEFKKWLEEKE